MTYVSTKKTFRYAFESLLDVQGWETHLIIFAYFLIGCGLVVGIGLLYWAVSKIDVTENFAGSIILIAELIAAVYFLVGIYFSLGLKAAQYFKKNGFPCIDALTEPGKLLLRILETLAYYFIYVFSFWQDKIWLLSYFIYPIAILRVIYHAIRLEFMLEIAIANPELSLSECAKRSWKLTEKRVTEQIWLQARLIIAAILLLVIPLVGFELLPGMLIPIAILGFIFYSLFPLIMCIATSAAKIVSLRDYVDKDYGHGAFSSDYFFSKNNYGKSAYERTKYQYNPNYQTNYGGRSEDGRSYAGRYGRPRRERTGDRRRTYEPWHATKRQSFSNIYDSSDGEWILRQLREMSLRNDYCAMLGVIEGTSEEKIKEAYRLLAMRFHPDRHSNNPQRQRLVSEIFKYINEAYSNLNR